MSGNIKQTQKFGRLDSSTRARTSLVKLNISIDQKSEEEEQEGGTDRKPTK